MAPWSWSKTLTTASLLASAPCRLRGGLDSTFALHSRCLRALYLHSQCYQRGCCEAIGAWEPEQPAWWTHSQHALPVRVWCAFPVCRLSFYAHVSGLVVVLVLFLFLSSNFSWVVWIHLVITHIFTGKFYVLKRSRAGEVPQWLILGTTLAEDPSLTPSWAAYNYLYSSSRNSTLSPGLSEQLYSHTDDLVDAWM